MLTFAEGTFGKDFGGLLKGSHVSRLMKGDNIMRRLLPETERERLKGKGLACSAHHEPSKTNPRLVFLFTRNGSAAGCWVTCDVGKHTLQTERGEEKLHSLRQVFRRVREAVKALDA